MTRVNVSTLKARLSRYLRAVRRGEEIVVTDRNLPIARVVPFREEVPFKLETHAPKKRPEELRTLRFTRARGIDTLAVLLEERRNNR
jgi:prevent-host-death family protein